MFYYNPPPRMVSIFLTHTSHIILLFFFLAHHRHHCCEKGVDPKAGLRGKGGGEEGGEFPSLLGGCVQVYVVI